MDNNVIFLVEGLTALFLSLYMFLNGRRYRKQGFDHLSVLFGFIFVKSAIFYYFKFNNVDLISDADPTASIQSFIANPDFLPLYRFKMTMWHYLETILPFGYAFFFIPKVMIAHYRETAAKRVRIATVAAAIIISIPIIIVLVLSILAGRENLFQTHVVWIEFFKKYSFHLYAGIRLITLFLVFRYVGKIYGIISVNARLIANFKKTIITFLFFDFLFCLLTWIWTPYLHINFYFIQFAAIVFMGMYGHSMSSDQLSILHEKIENMAKERHLIVSLIKKLGGYIGSEKFSMRRVSEDILDSAVKVLNAQSGALFLVETEDRKKKLRAQFVTGMYPPQKKFSTAGISFTESAVHDRLKHETFAFGEGLIGEVAKSGQSIFIKDAKKDARFNQTIPEIVTIISFIAVPLISQDEVFGVLAVCNDLRQFQQEDFSLLEILGNFDHMAHTINEFSLHMNELVAKKTAEVEALLEQQHGDYYLTSLLVKPLVVNQVKSQRVKVEFHIEQKKKFKFRKWNAEIGGDICIAFSIKLKGRNYIVFTNADGMGKSIQGAGGALVYGVVFINHVMRTLMLRSEQDKTPKEWIDDIYRDLQTIFESFDGSMLMSGVIGILDEETGKMWHFNCEHPFSVLYRDGKAAFIESENQLGRKIGTMGFAEMLIQENQLKPGDILYLGSDGRDDVKLGMNEETGTRIINEDETMFLRHVESGNGMIKEVAAAVNNSGELTDDFSLLKIYFTGQGALSGSTKGAPTFRDSLLEALACYKNGDYKGGREMLSLIEKTSEPGEERFKVYHLYGNIAYKQEQFKEALSFWNKALENSSTNEQMIKNIELLKKKLGVK
jgi:serine phosphatase RsbU (regulator of sigma subunit)